MAALGARPPAVESTDRGFIYYTRFFTGELPERRTLVHVPIGTFSLLTIPADNRTWSVTVIGASGDTPLKMLRDPARFTTVVRACPLHAHWLDGQPITAVLPLAGILDRYRHFLSEGRPVVTGLLPVGDAWACTNPSAGRGISLGLLQAQALRRLVREHLGTPIDLVQAWAAATDAHITPFYRHQITADRARIAEINALRAGRPAPPSPSPITPLLTMMTHDPTAMRAALDIIACLALPADVLTRPEVITTIEQAQDIAPTPIPGPDRKQLLNLLT
ncbi:MAG: hypothetical protein JOY78_08310 [Pseudonocardia sp.]|nr:hypothetical protein [Pseudonocardia sp.]